MIMIFSSFDRTSKPVENLQFGSNFLASKDLHNTEGANLHMSDVERERETGREGQRKRKKERERGGKERGDRCTDRQTVKKRWIH